MSSTRFAIPFRGALKGSLLLAIALIFIHGGALFWLFSFVLPLWVKFVVAPVIIGSALQQLRCHLLQKGKRAVTGLEWDGGDEWQLQMAQGQSISARLLGSSFVSPWLIVLNFKTATSRRLLPVIIMADTIDSTSFRRLTSKLRRLAGTVEKPVV